MHSDNWHALDAHEVLRALGTNGEHGLTSDDVAQRQKRYGANEITERRRWWFMRSLGAQLASPLVFILLAAGLATAALSEWLDAIVIAMALLVTLVVGLLQEGKAKRVFATLARSQAPLATVIRNGEKQQVLAREVVPGDIIALADGRAVPADARLIRATSLSVNEAALTGEWAPVEKSPEVLSEGAVLGDRRNMLWSGTSLVSGEGVAVVVATGAHTAFGTLAGSLEGLDDGATPLQKSVRHLARILSMLVGAAVLIIMGLGLWRDQTLLETSLTAIAVAVAAIPSGLPAAVTIVLAIGMEAILRKGGLVRNLLAAETLGSTTYILTDKTGTLTEGNMSVAGSYTARSMAAKDDGPDHADNRALIEAAVLASDAFVTHDEEGNLDVVGRPVERAVVLAGLAQGFSQQDLFMHGHERLAFLPFSSSRRFSASLNEHAGGTRLYLMGAPEHLLEVSDQCMVAGTARVLDEKTREAFVRVQRTASAEGKRFIAVAYRAAPGGEIPKDVRDGKHPKQLVFMGLIALADTIRPDVAAEIARAKEAGIKVAMVTGDYPETARAVAMEVGIAEEGAVVCTGSQMDAMKDDELVRTLMSGRIFARVLPEQKLRIARVLKSAGEVVAMTGDGVNDAPALVAADIGVAVGSGTDVAKEASDIVLLKNTFSTITAAVAEGRRVIDNVRTIVAYLLSTSFSEVLVIGGALAVGAPVPLLPGQILWANLVEEGLMSFPFAFEPADRDVMKRKPLRHAQRAVLSRSVRRLMVTVTAITAAVLLGLYALLRYWQVPIEEARTVMFVALSIDSILFAFSFRDLHQPIWRINFFSNPWVLAGITGSFGLLIFAMTFPPLRYLLSLTPISLYEWIALIAIGIIIVVTIELAKLFFFEKGRDTEE